MELIKKQKWFIFQMEPISPICARISQGRSDWALQFEEAVQ